MTLTAIKPNYQHHSEFSPTQSLDIAPSNNGLMELQSVKEPLSRDKINNDLNAALTSSKTFLANAKPQPQNADLIARFASFPQSEKTMRYVDAKEAVEYFNDSETFGEQAGSLLLFGYGSLANADSASITIQKSSVETRQQATAIGWSRIFEKDVAQNIGNSFRSNPEERDVSNPFRASLNMRQTNDINHKTNGAVYKIKSSELPDLIAREEGYDLAPIRLELESGESVLAYTFTVKSMLDHYRYNIDGEIGSPIEPRPNYLDTVRTAMKEIGENELETFNATTYLADRTTLIKDYQPSTAL